MTPISPSDWDPRRVKVAGDIPTPAMLRLRLKPAADDLAFRSPTGDPGALPPPPDLRERLETRVVAIPGDGRRSELAARERAVLAPVPVRLFEAGLRPRPRETGFRGPLRLLRPAPSSNGSSGAPPSAVDARLSPSWAESAGMKDTIGADASLPTAPPAIDDNERAAVALAAPSPADGGCDARRRTPVSSVVARATRFFSSAAAASC
mmetsp:Transcript_1248/g.4086  ORF Transcript_1248/g.4086 Transcript_1248/m.4086 type:complete len:207 (-) Transcript_1248:3280-3900(-)